MSAERGQVLDRPARHALKRIMAIGRADYRANYGTAVHDRGELGKDFADLEAGNLRGDGRKLAANLIGRVHLQIEHVLVRRAAAEEHVDHGFLPRGLTLRGLQSTEVSQ